MNPADMVLLSIPTTLFVFKSHHANILRKETIFRSFSEIRGGVPENLPTEIPAALLIGDTGYVLIPSMVKTVNTRIDGFPSSEMTILSMTFWP